MTKLGMAAALLFAATSFATPAVAQRSVADYGNYTDVTDIHVLPGQWENYMDWLKENWVKQNEWAKKKGYIVGYKALASTYTRKDEANLYLLIEYKDVPTQAEQRRRQDEFAAYMKKDEHQMNVEGAARAPMRTRGSELQLQEVSFK